jgi:hypothetical protein
MLPTVVLLAVMALATIPTRAQTALTASDSADLDTLQAQPGVEILRSTKGDREFIEIRRNRVVVPGVRQGDKVETVEYGSFKGLVTVADVPEAIIGDPTDAAPQPGGSMVEVDHSGHGAVLCVWQLCIYLREALNACFADSHTDLRQDLTDGITAMNGFIVSNSLHPISSADVEAAVAATETRARLQLSLSNLTPDRVRACRTDAVGHMVTQMAEKTREQRRQIIRDLLSVPRPPVMNPCL